MAKKTSIKCRNFYMLLKITAAVHRICKIKLEFKLKCKKSIYHFFSNDSLLIEVFSILFEHLRVVFDSRHLILLCHSPVFLSPH